MWPWGHLAAGYLLYRLLTRRRTLDELAALTLAFATQLPDLIDKPLAWTVQVLPNGRSLGHSLVLAGPILLALILYTDGRRRRIAVALTVGYLTHLATDALYPAIAGEFHYTGFLGWPIVPPIEYSGTSEGILAHFLQFQLTPQSGFEFLLVAIAGVLWLADGMPGLRLVFHTAKNGVARVRDALSPA